MPFLRSHITISYPCQKFFCQSSARSCPNIAGNLYSNYLFADKVQTNNFRFLALHQSGIAQRLAPARAIRHAVSASVNMDAPRARATYPPSGASSTKKMISFILSPCVAIVAYYLLYLFHHLVYRVFTAPSSLPAFAAAPEGTLYIPSYAPILSPLRARSSISFLVDELVRRRLQAPSGLDPGSILQLNFCNMTCFQIFGYLIKFSQTRSVMN